MIFHKATNWTVSTFKKDANGEYVADSSPYKAAALDSHEMDRASGICTVYSHHFDAASNATIHRIRCKKHLWSVEGPDKEAVRRQAVHYFIKLMTKTPENTEPVNPFSPNRQAA